MGARGVGTEVVVDNQSCALAFHLQFTVIGRERAERPLRGSVERTVAVLRSRSTIEDASLLKRTVEHMVLRIVLVVVVSDERVRGRSLDGAAEDGIAEQGVVGPETLKRVGILNRFVKAEVAHGFLPYALPLISCGYDEEISRVLSGQFAYALQQEVALNEHGVGVDLFTVNHAALYRLGRIELVLLVAGQLLADGAEARVVKHYFIKVVAIGQRAL